MYTRDVKLSFPNNNIKKFTLCIFTLYVTVLTSFQENDPYIYIPYTDIGMAKSGSNLVESPKPYSPSHALCKSKKIFSRCLTLSCDDIPSNWLGLKSFSISEDLVKTIVALNLNIAKWYSEWYSGWWWCITIQSLIDQRYYPGKQSLKFRTFPVTLTLNTAKQPFHKTLQLMNMYCQTKLVQQFRSSKLTLIETFNLGCDIDLEHSNPIFSLDSSLLMIIYH